MLARFPPVALLTVDPISHDAIPQTPGVVFSGWICLKRTEVLFYSQEIVSRSIPRSFVLSPEFLTTRISPRTPCPFFAEHLFNFKLSPYFRFAEQFPDCTSSCFAQAFPDFFQIVVLIPLPSFGVRTVFREKHCPLPYEFSLFSPKMIFSWRCDLPDASPLP